MAENTEMQSLSFNINVKLNDLSGVKKLEETTNNIKNNIENIKYPSSVRGANNIARMLNRINGMLANNSKGIQSLRNLTSALQDISKLNFNNIKSADLSKIKLPANAEELSKFSNFAKSLTRLADNDNVQKLENFKLDLSNVKLPEKADEIQKFAEFGRALTRLTDKKTLQGLKELNLDLSRVTLPVDMGGIKQFTSFAQSLARLTGKTASNHLKELNDDLARINGTLNGFNAETLEKIARIQVPRTPTERKAKDPVNKSAIADTLGQLKGILDKKDVSGNNFLVQAIPHAMTFFNTLKTGTGVVTALKTALVGVGGGWGALISGGITVVQKFIGWIKKANDSINAIYAKIFEIGKAAAQVVGAQFKNLFNKFFGGENVITRFLHNVASALSRIVLYRSIRYVISGISTSLREGINNFYQFSSTINGEFKSAMDTIATSTQYAKNSLGAMASPIINVLAPAIDYLIDKFVALVNIINQFFSALFGGLGFFFRAKKVAHGFGGAIGGAGKQAKKAAKEIKDALLGIDELNIIKKPEPHDNNGGGGGGGAGGGFGDMFEKVPINKDILDFAKKLREAFEKSDWEGLGRLLGEKVNEIVNKIDWAKIGAKLGRGIDGVVRTLYSFLDTVDFRNIGSKFAILFNNALANIDTSKIGRLLIKQFTIAWDVFIGFIDELDYSLLAKKLSSGISGAMQEINKWFSTVNYDSFRKFGAGITEILSSINFREIGTTLADGFNHITHIIKSFFDNFDLRQFAINFAQGINDFFLTIKFDDTIETLKEVVHNIFESIKAFFKTLKTQDIAEKIVEGINSILNEVVDFFNSADGAEIVDAITNFMNTIIEKIDWEKFGEFLRAKFVAKIKPILRGLFSMDFGGAENALQRTMIGAVGLDKLNDQWGKALENVPAYETKGVDLGFNVLGWLGEHVWNPMKEWFSNTFTTENFSALLQPLSNGLKSGMTMTIGMPGMLNESIGQPTNEWFGSNFSADKFEPFGANVTNGLAQGASANASANAEWLENSIWNPTNQFFDTNFNADKFSPFGQAIPNGLSEGVEQENGGIGAWLEEKIGAPIKDWFTSVFDPDSFSMYGNNLIQGFLTGMTEAMSEVETWIQSNLFDNFAIQFESLPDKIIPIIDNLRVAIMDAFKGGESGDLEQSFTELAERILQGFNLGIERNIESVIAKFRDLAKSIIDRFTGSGDGEINENRFSQIAETALGGFIDKVESLSSRIEDSFRSLGEEIVDTFKNSLPPSAFEDAADNIADGFINGLERAKYKMLDAVRNVANEVQETFRNAMEIHSPSRVFERFGKYTVQGYAQGIDEEKGTATDKLKELIREAIDAMNRQPNPNDNSDYQNVYNNSMSSLVYKVDVSDSSNSFAEYFNENVLPIIKGIADDTKRQADKREETVLQISGKEVAKAVKAQQDADGYAFC